MKPTLDHFLLCFEVIHDRQPVGDRGAFFSMPLLAHVAPYDTRAATFSNTGVISVPRTKTCPLESRVRPDFCARLESNPQAISP